jgi:hypothetical protein
MTDLNEDPTSINDNQEIDADIQPSWKPLFWSVGVLAALVGLGELVIEFGLDTLEFVFELLEKVYLVVVEAPEELLEDKIEDWLAEHFPHQAARYSELITAIGLTPLKILLGLLLLRWLWRHSRHTLLPRFARWVRRQWLAVRLAWRLLAWPYKALVVAGAVGSLFIFI